MVFSNALRSNIWKFYFITALGIRFITPIRILYLISFGLTFTQIGFMELAASIAILVLEIPTGIFADIFGRKTSRLIAYFLSITAFSIMSFGSTLPVFILGWTLSGAADAFQSGAQDALIFDTLKALKRPHDYVKIKSHFSLITTISVILGSVTGSYLFTLDRRLPWYLITATIIFSALVFLSVEEPPRLKKHLDLSKQIQNLKLSIVQTLRSSIVKKIIILSTILSLPMFVFITLLNQPYLISVGFSVQTLGIVFAVITLISGLVSLFTHKIGKLFELKQMIFSIIVSLSFLLIILGVIQKPVVLLFVVMFYIIDNIKNILFDNYLNLSIPTVSRASVLSLQSFINNLIISLVFVIVGKLVDVFSINIVLIYLGLATFITAIPIWFTLQPKT